MYTFIFNLYKKVYNNLYKKVYNVVQNNLYSYHQSVICGYVAAFSQAIFDFHLQIVVIGN